MEKRDSVTQAFALEAIVDYRKKLGESTICAFLFKTMIARNADPKIVSMINEM